MYGYIYLTTNLITGQKYIGMHKYSGEGVDPDYIGSGKHLWNSINCHGYDKYKDFKCEILEYCETEEEASRRERYYTDEYNAVEDPMYYNLNPGGHGGFDYINRNRLSPSCSGNPEDHPMYGVQGENNPRYGTHHSEETKAILSEIQKDRVEITNGVTVKRIKKDQPLDDGWEYGAPYNPNREWTDERRAHHSELMTGLVTINNGVITKRVREDELQSELDKGWVLGYRDDQAIKGKRENLPDDYNDHIKNSKWVTNGHENHRAKGYKLEKYLNEGFWLGLTKQKDM